MNNWKQRTALGLGACIVLAGGLSAHGGNYPGPGDVVAPGGGNGGSGGSGPTGPVSPGGGTPGAPAPPSPGVSGGPPTPGADPSRPNTPTGPPPIEEAHWSFWWDLNKARYLRLRDHIYAAGPESGGDDFFIGEGQVDQGRNTRRPTREDIERDVVPELLNILATETDNDILTGAMLALAKIGDVSGEDGESPFAKTITPFLADPNQEIAETAALALGILGHASSAELLAHLLRDDATAHEAVGSTEVSFRTRAFAAYGLALLARESANPDLRRFAVAEFADALDGPTTASYDVEVACTIAFGLVALEPGDDAVAFPPADRGDQVAYLLDKLERGERALPNLALAHVPTAVARLTADLGDVAENPLKVRAAEALLALVDEHGDASREVQQSAVLALGQLGDCDSDVVDREIRTALIELEDAVKDQLARNFRYIAMARVGAREGHGEDASQGRGKLQHALLQGLSERNATNSSWAALGVGVLGYHLAESGASPATALGEAVRHKLSDEGNPDLVGSLAIAAGLMRDAESATTLRRLFDEVQDEEARGHVAVALGLMEDTQSKPELERVCADSTYRPLLLKRTAIGLGLMKDRNVVKVLIEKLTNAASLAGQSSACTALGFIGDSSSIGPLVEALTDEERTDRARGFAAVALGLIAEDTGSDLPWHVDLTEDLNYRAAPSSLNDTSGTGIVNIL